jgi:class 3 adenylate cyclase
VTLLFPDLVGSTRLLDRLGDEAAGRLRRDHFALLRREIAAAGGEEVKSLGDGLMVAFTSARAAMACAVAMQRSVTADRRSGRPLRIRVGVHSGRAHREEEDFFGIAVVVARRLCDAAPRGGILASEAAHRLAGPETGFIVRPVGPLPLKGLVQPVAAVALDWRAAPPVRMPARPVSPRRQLAGRDGQRRVVPAPRTVDGYPGSPWRCPVTTVLTPTADAAATRRLAFADVPWEGVTRRHLQHIGVGPGWRCLVAAGGPSITGWLEMQVGDGAVLEVGTTVGGVPEGCFDLVLLRLGDDHVLDRAATVDRFLAALRPGGWLVIEDDVTLPFELPVDATVAGASTPAAVVQTIRAAAEDHAAELEWARGVPVRLLAQGCRYVAAQAHCSVWPGGATTIALPAPDADDGAGDLPVELEPFTRLLVNPFRGGLVPSALAAGSYVLFTTCARR